jgi:hypothetical protein
MRNSLFILFVIAFCSFRLHPFHVSVTEMKYNQQSHTIEISTRLFINDFENILKKKYGVAVDLYQQNESESNKSLMNKYLQEHLQVKVANKNIPINLLGSEREDDALWIYLETPILPMPNVVEIRNSVLFDLFDDQANILHFELLQQRKSHKLVAPDRKIIFSF